MSFHRVLPLLPALSNEALERRWAIQPDTLLSSKIMPDETNKAALKDNNNKSPTPPTNSSSPPEGRATLSPEDEELDDYDSPKYPTRSLLRESDSGHPTSKIPRPSLAQDSDAWIGEPPSSLCLCQPDPKVPRPRNAFILYRQHNQAGVVQQNPGLANPEISKIIGDHWRNLSPEEKNHWKLLADEEKLRHQKQYPDYRYQPRRSGRNSSLSTSQPSSTETSPRKCPKCGGHSIQTSSMMYNSVAFPNHLQATPATPYSPSNSLIKTPNSGNRFLRGLGSPTIGQPPAGHRAPRQSTAPGAPLRLISPPYSRAPDPSSSPRFSKRPDSSRPFLTSPDPKRRRVNNATHVPVRNNNGPGTPFPFTSGHSRRQSLPRPDFMGPGIVSPVTMGPPPRPHNTTHHPSAPLTLAPLQNIQANDSMNVDTQAKSLEAMILSIPTLGKIRVLAKISPPLAPPSPSSPARQTRGLLIAIDASDPLALKQLTRTLSQNLEDHAVRVFPTPTAPSEEAPSFQAYLRLMDEYHTLSQQVVQYITTAPGSTSPQESPSPVSPKSFPKDNDTHNTSAANEASCTPIAIVPGYQVTWSDWFASHVSIGDAYSPMDHWQWGATLWRNVVGADITVAVQAAAPTADDGPAASTTSSKNKDAAGKGGGDEGEKKRKAAGSVSGSSASLSGGGVEVRLEEARAVIVRGEAAGGVAVGGLRRVGFEIGEWVRGWGERVDRRGSAGGAV